MTPALQAAIAAIRAGRMVIMVDDEDRENEGDLVIAAECATPEAIAFMATHGRGLICLPLEPEQVDRLGLSLQPRRGHDPRGTAFTVSIEATHGITTGISAADRARTVRLAADPATDPAEISTPGHIFPLRAHPGGVLARDGHTEGSIALARLAGLEPAAVICEVMREDGAMARLPELRRLAATHDLPVISIAEIVAHLRATTQTRAVSVAAARAAVLPVAEAALPTAFGGNDLRIHAFRAPDGTEHVALVKGDPALGTPLVRLHSECVTGDALGSLRCDCGAQLREALHRIGAAESGVLVYLRGHEGRGIGLGNKIRAYELQDAGLDTVDANLALGLPAEARNWDAGAAILRALGVTRLVLLTNNPAKTRGLAEAGLTVLREERLETAVTPFNHAYLHTKRTRMGHVLAETAPRPSILSMKETA
ncbi:bifunctional 3,4-dihydroxy-2-butanone-4-phosphate synthase/GTP cyclohydrolase II [Acidomonas methanolica]|uniref:Multifunctional fusion protein n=1 Tax=Acidomonas methanolica NBRC 104435 TaxID=1231351 RepID=A0A023D3E8_ACIMT|nr:bifunctional 3,4-dihydroxy-2-butanone-4-phosphate synthase/GTP cyclohydrolase II [Acidomonas methanolica]MBU2654839.1 bifunctional 3,4-dihydroxy-2-butanone-4-phosphate synthase/GTP cyclohydrolase II [Acidomonas methanolica]TCS26503.1 3,4-dihydroxy 2-butanone 4-phosphate synthase/GTP cyclohydrolase II [Acidomonas methanolica]GAJ28662.1 bifunctional 3,4-dihydroxy-2-butanone 4-phosphate synthase/GTP cyclohydrolase II [Acidomonas methanolica NBRC 104435]GBQ53084.1 3,4-dihydroxy-2-butanone 4-phos